MITSKGYVKVKKKQRPHKRLNKPGEGNTVQTPNRRGERSLYRTKGKDGHLVEEKKGQAWDEGERRKKWRGPGKKAQTKARIKESW